MAGEFGPYVLHELLGRGGMGEVYRAFDRNQSRFVALKLLAPSLADDAVFVERFKREALATATLNDPHVIPIHHFGEIDGRLYIDMRLVEGADLARVLARDGALPAARAAWLIAQAAEALDAAHARGLLHRDVKPSNLLVTGQDFVYLVDFGLVQGVGGSSAAPLTSAGLTIGTFGYLAPERMSADRPVDGRADVYSLTCVLFEALTGRRPFPAEDIAALTVAHLSQAPPRLTDLRPDLPRQWDDVIARGMAKSAGDRFATAGALAAAVRDALAATGGAADRRSTAPVPMAAPAPETRLSPRRTVPPEQPGAVVPPPDGRRRMWVIAGSSVGAVLLVVLVTLAMLGGWFSAGPTSSAGQGQAGTTTTPDTGSSDSGTTAAGTTTTSTTVDVPKFDAQLMSIFPDLVEPAGVSCATYVPKAGEFVGPAGVLPAALVACDYAAVPSGKVFYVRWPDVGIGPQWVQQLRPKFQVAPGMESTQFQTNGAIQGPYFAAQSGNAGVLIYACYDRVPECVVVQAPTAEETQKLWSAWQSTQQ